MGCAAGKPNVAGGTDQPSREFEKAPPTARIERAVVPPIAIDDSITISARTSQGLAFEVPLEEGETNMIKKHPPKRFQKLEDQQISSLTHRLLDEKQAEADQRRQQILSQRVQSAKVRQKTKRSLIHNGEVSSDNEEGMDASP